MRPDQLCDPQELLPLVQRLGNEPVDLELFVLKCHLIAERQLYSLLAIRLDMLEKHLPPLNFLPLAKLALGGGEHSSTLLKALALNDLRNEYGHELNADRLREKMKALADRTTTFWPPFDGPDLHDAWIALCDSAVRIACFECIGAIWVHIVELSLAKGRYSSEAAAARAREELVQALSVRANRHDQQVSFKEIFGRFFGSAQE